MGTLKLVDADVLDAGLTSIANAIRTKGGTSDTLEFPSGFIAAIQAIPTPSTGHTITVNLSTSVFQMMEAYIKLNTAPSSASDYDYHYSGGVGSYDSDIPATITANKVYIWGEGGEVTAPSSIDLLSHRTYSTAAEITYSADGTLGLSFYYDE